MSRPRVAPVQRPVARALQACALLLFTLVLALLPAASASAFGTCSISGTVSTGEGNGFSNATVTLYDQAGGVVGTTGSDYGGAYSFTSLDPGIYRIGFYGVSRNDAYLRSFYHGAATLDDAEPIAVTDEAPAFTGADGVVEWLGYGAPPQGRADGSWSTAETWDVDGKQVAVSGEVAAVGTPYTYHAGVNESGAVCIYVRGSSGWRLRQVITSPAPVSYGYFGRALDLEGDTLVVAQYEDDAQYAKPGRVFVYTLRGSTFRLQDELVASGDALARGGFGQSLALDEDVAVVGASHAQPGGQREAGAAFVFSRSGDQWTQLQKLVQNHPQEDSYFGECVALQGGLIAVGAPQEDTSAGVGAGVVYLFRRGETGWGAGSRLLPDDPHIGDGFGSPIALSGDTLLVRASAKDDWGAVYAFVRGAGGWSQQAILPRPKLAGDLFGEAIDLQGDEALVGWPALEGEVSGAICGGAAYYYRRSGSTWHRIAQLGYEEKYRQSGVGCGVTLADGDFFVSTSRDSYIDEIRRYAVRIYRPYICEAGETLVVPASRGLLSNDVWPDGEKASADPFDLPAHGTLRETPDGAFWYTPAPGFVGADTFDYRLQSDTFSAGGVTPASVLVQDSAAPIVDLGGVQQRWVSAPVTVVLAAEDATQVRAVDYRRTTVTTWQRYVRPFRVTREGTTPYRVRASDALGNARLSGFTVRVDTRRPSVSAPSAATGKAGGKVTFTFEVSDPRPGGPWADVTIEVFKGTASRGSIVLKRQPVNRLLTRPVTCWLAKGTYRFVVTAKDAAANTQRSPAANRLVVK